MRVLVAGAAGFVGSHLTDRLLERDTRSLAEGICRQVAWHRQMRDRPCRAELRMV
jgi:nucleoside-diphosphate-sugar epimerase